MEVLMKWKTEHKYCYRCMCIREQRVCPEHYSVTPKYRCACGKINSDQKYCFKMPAPIVFR